MVKQEKNQFLSSFKGSHLYSFCKNFISYPKYFVALCIISILFSSCDEWFLIEIENEIAFPQKLTSFELYQGNISDLNPADGIFQYDLNTPLFTDYASKQRLIKLPKQGQMSITDQPVLSFPDSTIIAKTFYYTESENESHKILETRILIKRDEKWNVGVYQWNEEQNEAFLIKNGADTPITFYHLGKMISTEYHIPSNAECTTCHNSNRSVSPIGPKLINLNRNHSQTKGQMNQLEYWKYLDKLNGQLLNIDGMPNWEDPSYPLSDRARAYLDVNCAHCHNPTGVARDFRLDLSYSTPLYSSGIPEVGSQIIYRMESSWEDEKMPKIGTTIQHEEGIELIKKYLNDLN